MMVDEWRYPLLFGIISLVIGAAIRVQQWVEPSNLVLVPVFVAGTAVGYLFSTQSFESKKGGWRTGLIGGLVLPFFTIEFVQLIPEVAAGSAFRLGIVYILSAIVLTFWIIIHGFVGAVGGLLGDHLANRIEGSSSKTMVE